MNDLAETEILERIEPAPLGMMAVFWPKNKPEHKEPVAAQAIIIEDHFTHSTRFVAALVVDFHGEYRIANRLDSFDRFEWRQQAACQCSTTSKKPFSSPGSTRPFPD